MIQDEEDREDLELIKSSLTSNEILVLISKAWSRWSTERFCASFLIVDEIRIKDFKLMLQGKSDYDL